MSKRIRVHRNGHMERNGKHNKKKEQKNREQESEKTKKERIKCTLCERSKCFGKFLILILPKLACEACDGCASQRYSRYFLALMPFCSCVFLDNSTLRHSNMHAAICVKEKQLNLLFAHKLIDYD